MAGILETVLKLKRPLVAACFLLGALLVLLGLGVVAFKVGGVESQQTGTVGRVAACAFGVALLVSALLLDRREDARRPGLPEDLSRSYAERQARLGKTQLLVLRYVTTRTESPGSRVSEQDVASKFQTSGAEAYYRLEQLRLLGFVRKENLGGIGRNHYALSEDYARSIRHGSSSPPAAV